MAAERLPDDFVRRLTDVQDRLYAYILALLPDRAAAREVLQEANVVMCRKFDTLKPDQDFDAWACQVAFYEVKTYRRSKSRDRLVFNDDLLSLVAEDVERENAGQSLIGLFAKPVSLEDWQDSQKTSVRRYLSVGTGRISSQHICVDRKFHKRIRVDEVCAVASR